ncbi:hypothetical protein C4E21_08635 [Bacillus subtilis]|nr:hypothetical protein C4E21_08635 [Bacillus subtilis]RFM39535.1 hypothetical protein D0N38_07010 [Bacillus inaquosorum]
MFFSFAIVISVNSLKLSSHDRKDFYHTITQLQSGIKEFDSMRFEQYKTNGLAPLFCPKQLLRHINK